MRRFIRSLLTLSALATAGGVSGRDASAAETYEFYNGVRPLGMGGASLSAVNDETALLINPAALGKLRDHFVTVADPEVDAGINTATLVGSDVLKAGNPQATLAKLLKHPDQHLHQRAQVFPSIVTRGFGLGAFGKQMIDAEVPSGGKYMYNYRADTAAVMGFGTRVGGGVLKFGATSRLVNRREVARADLDPAASGLSLASLATEGVGLGADAAAMISVPVNYLPTLTMVWRDLGQTSFTLAKGLMHPTALRPALVRDSVDLGFAIYPILTPIWRATWSLQYDDVAHDPSDVLRHVHFGTEFNYADSVFLRGGINQRYWTAGLELAYVGYQIQFATYGEEIGTKASPREDRRAVAKLAIRY